MVREVRRRFSIALFRLDRNKRRERTFRHRHRRRRFSFVSAFRFIEYYQAGGANLSSQSTCANESGS